MPGFPWAFVERNQISYECLPGKDGYLMCGCCKRVELIRQYEWKCHICGAEYFGATLSHEPEKVVQREWMTKLKETPNQ